MNKVGIQLNNGNLPGILLTAIIAFIAYHIGELYPLVGGAVTAIILGFLVSNFLGVPVIYEKGINFTLKKLLKLAIIILGFSMSFTTIVDVGFDSIIIVLISVILGLFLTYWIARLFKLTGDLPILVGVGTAICGATAIATVSSILKAKEEDFVYAVNTIFAFNVLAVMAYPFIGHLAGLSDEVLGIWAGAAIHDTSSVVAAGYAYSDEAGSTAVVVKLLRTLTLIPVALLLAFFTSYREKGKGKESTVKIWSIFPYFIFLFVGAALINTFLPLPEIVTETTSDIAKFMIIMVMASVGLKANFGKLKSIGFRPFIVGLLSSVIIGVVSITLVLMLAG
ncbi:YeiH family protein [Ornithinibacillus halophilus]|uniref:Conserved hypothetical integral membrane protein n=1 Tax=Ornithinibacillus halophilus TaxID=930117 RepID=A0A1M5HKK4_9BACI|nr:YeiH family protein [Ornithinibacillus halophilus]SHG16431.1 conserved hypothetical integral membrane protein [Ornithinibacillus halophilus]